MPGETVAKNGPYRFHARRARMLDGREAVHLLIKRNERRLFDCDLATGALAIFIAHLTTHLEAMIEGQHGTPAAQIAERASRVAADALASRAAPPAPRRESSAFDPLPAPGTPRGRVTP